jgi:ATP-binding cassette subfamily B protein
MNQKDLDAVRFKQAFNQAVKHYWRETRSNWKLSFPGLFLPSINNILISYVPPLAVTGIIATAIDGQSHSFGDFLPYLALFAGSWLGAEIIMRIGIEFMIRSEIRAANNLYDRGLSQLLQRDLSFFRDNFAGSLTKKTMGYANRYIDVFDTMSFSVIYQLVPIIFASVVLWIYSPWLVLVLLSWFSLAIIVTLPLIRKRREMVTVRETASNVVSGHIADVYGNIDAVRAHAAERAEEVRNRHIVADLMQKSQRSWNFQNRVIDVAIAPIFIITNISGLLLSIYLAQHGVILYASIYVVTTYYLLVTGVMWQFNSIYRRLESSLSDAAQYTELLMAEPTVLDPAKPVKAPPKQASVTFNDVHFQYEENSRKLFAGFSLDIKAGEKIGLVGRSGGGKSSITKLLLRFTDIDSGSIQIGGIDITQMTQADLRALIAYVPQDPVMFHRSIHDNIGYGDNNATREQVIAAAKKAHAHEFIMSLHNGYETMVGERGIKLSGGQRQRIAIARAILKDAPILLLDEATSALDSESEKLIQDALKKLMRGKTSLIIAHRLSTIQNMDRIIVLEKGEVIEQGSHAELIAHDGMYSKLWKHQSGGFIEE